VVHLHGEHLQRGGGEGGAAARTTARQGLFVMAGGKGLEAQASNWKAFHWEQSQLGTAFTEAQRNTPGC
jgi:hypothetical protein